MYVCVLVLFIIALECLYVTFRRVGLARNSLAEHLLPDRCSDTPRDVWLARAQLSWVSFHTTC